MKCKVTAPFVDKFDKSVAYAVGDTVDWDDQERIADCVKRGLIEVIQAAKPKTTTTKKTTTKKTAK